jgi:hypothetical protein
MGRHVFSFVLQNLVPFITTLQASRRRKCEMLGNTIERMQARICRYCRGPDAGMRCMAETVPEQIPLNGDAPAIWTLANHVRLIPLGAAGVGRSFNHREGSKYLRFETIPQRNSAEAVRSQVPSTLLPHSWPGPRWPRAATIPSLALAPFGPRAAWQVTVPGGRALAAFSVHPVSARFSSICFAGPATKHPALSWHSIDMSSRALSRAW